MNNEDRQLVLEQEAITMGVERYTSKVDSGDLMDLPAGLLLMKHAIEPLSLGIQDFLAGSKRGHGVKATIEFIDQFKPNEVAYFVLRRLINALVGQNSLQDVCLSITTDMVDHLEYSKYKDEKGGHLHAVEKNLKHSTAIHKRRVIMRAKRQIGIEDTLFSTEQRMQMGSRLIHIAIETTGLVQKGKKALPKGQWLTILEPTEKITKWIDSKHKSHALMNPVHMPMVCPPAEWSTPFDGGYLTNQGSMQTRLVRTRDKETLFELASAHMPEVYKAINNMQKTQWKINVPVMDLVKELWRTGQTVGKSLPSAENKKLPPKPWITDAEFEELKVTNMDAVITWKNAAHEIHDYNASLTSKRIAVTQKLWMAEKFKDDEAIYFIWNLDWRGRLYPANGTFLSPQSDDLGAGLLTFTRGHKLGKTGAYALACTGAGFFGVDKVSLDDRVEWIKVNTKQILDVAENPLDNLWWTDADKPFHFYAFALEWAGYIKEGNDFVSHLPCNLDGSCNGIQHFAAMRKDVRGGTAVNLVPHAKPADIYSEVADLVRAQVVLDAINGNEFAKWWQDKVDRQICKRGVMTTPYGVSKRGMIDQIKKELLKQGVVIHRTPSEKPSDFEIDLHRTPSEKPSEDLDLFTVSKYLGNILFSCIGQVVVSSRETMDWLKSNTKLAGKEGKVVRWVTPVGFPVLMKYIKQKAIRVNTYWGKVNIKLTVLVNEDGDPIDTTKMVAAVAPCFVHSHDASHLMSTHNAAWDVGIEDFCPIHDSFGCHAAFLDTMNGCIRVEFINMYIKGDVLENFRNALLSNLPVEYNELLAPTPGLGSLDLNLVKEAPYFFA